MSDRDARAIAVLYAANEDGIAAAAAYPDVLGAPLADAADTGLDDERGPGEAGRAQPKGGEQCQTP